MMFMLSGTVTDETLDTTIKRLNNFHWGVCPHDNEDTSKHATFTGINFDHDLNLTSAAGYPLYTNYTEKFKDLLDYIFVDEKSWTVAEVVRARTKYIIY